MTVLDQINSELKQNQGNGNVAFLRECQREHKEASLVNDSDYRSRRKPSITYTDPGTASLSRLLESKNISNDNLNAILGFPKDRICHIRQKKHIPTELELARICIALELAEPTVILLFRSFHLDYDINHHLMDYYLHRVINSSEVKTMEARLVLFDSLTK